MTFHSVKQVADQLSVSASLVYQLVESGRLACHRIGTGRGAIRISHDDLQAYIASCRVEQRQERRPAPPRPRLKHLKL